MRQNNNRTRNKRVNPPTGRARGIVGEDPLDDTLTESMGTLLVTNAVMGLTFEEKAIIASIIAEIRPILRRAHAVKSQPVSTIEE